MGFFFTIDLKLNMMANEGHEGKKKEGEGNQTAIKRKMTPILNLRTGNKNTGGGKG